ncbi:hypothetical protein M2323_003973 [Rhodoblastus acidophilus]|uniref:hypothetical protein n=1 Tax=Rhodoblastus acidophilus TaxID=1074 RepID=UPI002225829F|nr:hypothetical protein [Rhodoblastus acidophilus]MCW2286136.1 hypothetical protein [Rhodoblastus acidophilus]MCW2335030.1 hypothetical protein [Rhodoblastus acidophilus]
MAKNAFQRWNFQKMAERYLQISSLFDPGKKRIEEALGIYREMQGRWQGGLGIIVEEHNGQLWLHHAGLGQRHDALIHAIGFVAECARQLGLSGTWSAEWSKACSEPLIGGSGGGFVVVDLETQAVWMKSTDELFAVYKALMNSTTQFGSKNYNKVPLPIEKAATAREWLKEKAIKDWTDFTRVVGLEKSSLAVDQVFLIKPDQAAIEFKFVFGGV